ncbi:hypothetical protein TIFTF001_007667 [Ficus carica]|uniref:Uncharacterized protein n=1 Tax=Ficus carica TaxID=3494 RepID=A0AA88A730_FICCA|nr:hypothetical protein TIFTF001_007667 [Ficus carica]
MAMAELETQPTTSGSEQMSTVKRGEADGSDERPG